MFMGYNLKLDRRTVKLEKKNGSEQKQINELKQEIQKLKEQNIKGFYFKSILKEKDHDQK
jgi:uncharacterized protein YlxW (UPF0749 family)